MKETLSDKFREERQKVNSEITDERVTAHCHTSINKLDDAAKKHIQNVKKELIGRIEPLSRDERHSDGFQNAMDICLKWINEIFKEEFGDELLKVEGLRK